MAAPPPPPPPPPPPRGTMSLYAELLSGPAAEPVAAAPAASAAVKSSEAKNPALRFQPIIRRPQQKTKAGVHRLKSLPVVTPSTSVSTSARAAAGAAPSTTNTSTTGALRTTLADWVAGADDDDDDDDYNGDNGDRRPQRGGRKRKKKRLEEKQQQQHHRRTANSNLDVDWDELYDPARPTNLEAYLHSDERVAAVRDWKAVLYTHRRRQRIDNRQGDDEGGDDNSDSSENADGGHRQQFNNAFAPPAAFAPPPTLTATSSNQAAVTTAQSGSNSSRIEGEDDKTSQARQRQSQPTSLPQPPPLLLQPQLQPGGAATAAPSLADGLIVSRAPVRFQAATEITDDVNMEASDDNGDNDAYEPLPATSSDPGGDPSSSSTSARPGQVGFAARLMAKYGWTKGSGLGADGSGILNPLRHKKIGGANSGRGRIVGGGGQRSSTKQQGEDEDLGQQQNTTTSSTPSTVVVLRNMVEGMPDLAAEVAGGQLVQEIGEECGEQYGRIERVYIDVPTRLVFIQFTDAVSALRAVTALDGRIFNGNAIAPSFYNSDNFEQGIYE